MEGIDTETVVRNMYLAIVCLMTFLGTILITPFCLQNLSTQVEYLIIAEELQLVDLKAVAVK